MVVSQQAELSALIRAKALELGFSHVGFAAAVPLDEERKHLETWLARGAQANMHWLDRDPLRRSDPAQVLPDCRTVISLAMNYYTPQQHAENPELARISRYAWGDDYHDVLDASMHELESFIAQAEPAARTRRYVDTGPVMDKAWAVRAGIGWQGKHSNVITRDRGSWVFLGEILTTLALDPDAPMLDYCGSCTSCLDACPTQAIVEPYVVDSNRCISYLTIEHRGDFPDQVKDWNFQNWVYGCDICQDVCPWNSFAQAATEPAFEARSWNVAPPVTELAQIDDEEFRRRFRKSPVKRTKADGLRRNARILLIQNESHTDSETETTDHRKDYGTS